MELGEWGWQAQLCVLEDLDVCRIANDEMCLEVSKNACELSGAKLVPEHINGMKNYEANQWLSHAKSTTEGVALINASEGAGAYTKCQAAIWTLI
ncbi:hypothetical protein EDD18DRAFT_1355860 [Armillaria luteobubalina]|uniref:Uncharacterized protein n=1 Tax=Armillaria luteobubalina TaxID=153913 RepID=A0AA39Q0K8_9AGAR|nr:hypothetical protein EDD18DRAFT_1355860 [Armillaria luteobubalina]